MFNKSNIIHCMADEFCSSSSSTRRKPLKSLNVIVVCSKQRPPTSNDSPSVSSNSLAADNSTRSTVGMFDSAIKMFEEMSKPESCGVDNVTYGTLLKCRRFTPALMVLLHDTAFCFVKGGNPSVLLYNLLMKDKALKFSYNDFHTALLKTDIQKNSYGA
ncbi:hypothetical protein Q3G72_018276 [Acer saccharum]|nr:hypothetical protein Q3G72_018276 [Acer saccharum]